MTSCIHLGAKRARLVERGQPTLWLLECRCDQVPQRFTHEERCGMDLVTVQVEDRRTDESVACCATCKYRDPPLRREPPKRQTVEEYLASTKGQPGTELHGILKERGYEVTETCACMGTIGQMNIQGPQWCLENIEKIVDVMVEEAKRRKIKVLGKEPPEWAMRIRGRAWVRMAVSASTLGGGSMVYRK